MLCFRNYWAYSAGLAIAWAINLLLTWRIRGKENAQRTLLVFSGFCIGWLDDDCPLHLSATKALGLEEPAVTSPAENRQGDS